MTLDESIRYAMMALVGVSIVLAAHGIHISPLDACGGIGGTVGLPRP